MTQDELRAYIGRPYADLPQGVDVDQLWPLLMTIDGVLTIAGVTDGTADDECRVEVVDGVPKMEDYSSDAVMDRCYCHGCGDELIAEQAQHLNGDPYCNGCKPLYQEH